MLQTSQTIQERIELAGIGVSTAGIVGRDGGIQYAGPTIPNYIGTPIKTSLAAQANLSVSVVNDVDAALLGEVFTGQLVNVLHGVRYRNRWSALS